MTDGRSAFVHGKRYAKQGIRILDTHAGSGSLEMACHERGLDCCGFEIDPVYYILAQKRLDDAKAQVSMMELVMPKEDEQICWTDKGSAAAGLLEEE